MEKLLEKITNIRSKGNFYNIRTGREIQDNSRNRKLYHLDDEYALAYTDADQDKYDELVTALDVSLNGYDEATEFDAAVNECYNKNKIYDIRTRNCVNPGKNKGAFFAVNDGENISDFMDIHNGKFVLDMEPKTKFKYIKPEKEKPEIEGELWKRPYKFFNIDEGYARSVEPLFSLEYNSGCYPELAIKCLKQGKVCAGTSGHVMKDGMPLGDAMCVNLTKKKELELYKKYHDNYRYDNKYNSLYIGDGWKKDSWRKYTTIDPLTISSDRSIAKSLLKRMESSDCISDKTRPVMQACFPEKWDYYFGDRSDSGKFKYFPDNPILDFVEEGDENDKVGYKEVWDKYKDLDGREKRDDFYRLFEDHWGISPEKVKNKKVYRGLRMRG